MIRIKIGLLVLLLSPSAFAQEAPDPAFLQKAVVVLQQQRNVAMDGQAQARTEAAILADENAKLKARIGELEKAAETRKQDQ